MHFGLSWWLSSKEPTCQYKRQGFNPWVRKIPRWRKWYPTLVFLPGKFSGQKNVVGYSPWACKRVGHNLMTKQQQHMHFVTSSGPLKSALTWNFCIFSVCGITNTTSILFINICILVIIIWNLTISITHHTPGNLKVWDSRYETDKINL